MTSIMWGFHYTIFDVGTYDSAFQRLGLDFDMFSGEILKFQKVSYMFKYLYCTSI